jgi:hypothetical protein
MLLISLLFITLCARVALGRNCSHAPIDESRLIQVERELSSFLASPDSSGLMSDIPTIKVPTFVHIINAGNSPNQGNVPNAAIENQLRVLNAAYAEARFEFELQGIRRTTHVAWSKDMFYRNEIEYEAKSALRVGGRNTLNLYVARLKQGLLGYATFPFDFYRNQKLDGVVIAPFTLPGGSLDYYNLGMTAVHEVGHWLGLFHTFQGGCKDLDMVEDTPAEQYPSMGCPIGRKTCPDCPGEDPVTNFMDYSVDGCMDHFTPGQIRRMHAHWFAYRDPAHNLRSHSQ